MRYPIRSWCPKYTRKLYSSITTTTTEKCLIEKVGRGHEKTLLQRGHTDDQQTYEEMLSITNHQGIANLNNNEMSSHTSRNGYYQKVDITWWGMEKMEPFCMLVGLHTNAAHMEKYGFLQKTRNRYAICPRSFLLGIYPKKTTTLTQKDGPSSYTRHKNKSKWIKDLNVRLKTIKMKKVNEALHSLWHYLQ